MKVGVIDVGGGNRGIYAAGVLDYCLDQKITFDIGIGISAGSANLASFIAGQKGRNYLFYTEYGFRKQYASLNNWIYKHSYIDMDYIYSVLSNHNGENPLDYYTMQNNPMGLFIVATNAITGQAHFFNKEDVQQDEYDVFKASSSIPFFCPPYAVKGMLYYDGALGDPVPVEKAFEMGCDRVILILTKPKDIPRKSGKDQWLAAGIRRKYPLAAQKLCERAQRYNDEVSQAKKYEEQGRLWIVAPNDTCGVDTLKKDKRALDRLYQKGYMDGRKIRDYLYDDSIYCIKKSR